MIVTVTLNPSLDRTLAVAGLVPGTVIRADATATDPGGKGVNVTRFLAAADTESIAVLPVGGATGQALVAALTDAGIDFSAVPIAGASRSNVTVVEPDGTTTKLNEPGPQLSDGEAAQLLATVTEVLQPASWVVVAGSLPVGLDTSIITDLAEAARAAGARFALDASGPALADGLKAHPDVIKPNLEELAELLGRELTSIDEVCSGCHEALALGAGTVLCSLGADGALLVTEDGAWHAVAQPVPVVSTVGAGDALLAGFLHAGGAGRDALRTGVAWATAAVQTPGTGVPPKHLLDSDAVKVQVLS